MTLQTYLVHHSCVEASSILFLLDFYKNEALQLTRQHCKQPNQMVVEIQALPLVERSARLVIVISAYFNNSYDG